MPTGHTPTISFADPPAPVDVPSAPLAPPATPTTIRPQTVDFVMRSYEDMEMLRLLPRFEALPSSVKVLGTVAHIPNPREVSTSLPEAIPILHETYAADPVLAFDCYIRGIAAVTSIVDPAAIEAVRYAAKEVADRVARGEELPRLDGNFSIYIRQVEHAVFSNGEHASWRNLIAFMHGAFWILGFVEKPDKRRGPYSPREFVHGMLLHFARQGYVPL